MTTTKPTRLTAEREAELRRKVEWGMGFEGATAACGELLAEIDALRSELATAEARGEQRGREAERADVLEWMRTKPLHWTGGETPLTRLYAQIERGEHVRGSLT